MSAFNHVDTIPPQEIWAGVVGRPVHGEKVTLALLELAPGAEVPEHQHENEQVGILIEGSLSFRIGDEAAEITPGGTWCIPAHVPHSVTVGPEGAVLTEVFSPPRHDWREKASGTAGRGRWP